MQRSFDILAAEYRPMVRTYLQALVRDPHLADDLTQETFLAAYKAIDRFESGCDFGAWLRGIARNKMKHHHRAAARRPLLADSRIIEGMEEVFQLFDSSAGHSGPWSERLQRIHSCMDKLTRTLRVVMEEVYTKGLSVKETAQKLNISRDAVMQRLSRARTQVRKCVSLSSGGAR